MDEHHKTRVNAETRVIMLGTEGQFLNDKDSAKSEQFLASKMLKSNKARSKIPS